MLPPSTTARLMITLVSVGGCAVVISANSCDGERGTRRLLTRGKAGAGIGGTTGYIDG
jgi:hypothetical protein